MGVRITLGKVNDELAGRGIQARLAKGDGYFYFRGAGADDWLDRTVNVATLNALTLDQWIDEFTRLKKLNDEIMGTASRGRQPTRTPGRKTRA